MAAATDAALATFGRSRADVDRPVCHPGGAKVLSAFEAAPDLGQGTLDLEREVLREHGNTSAPIVLDAARNAGRTGRKMATALGPGFLAAFALVNMAAGRRDGRGRLPGLPGGAATGRAVLQVLRDWALGTLGRRWTTRIVVDAPPVVHGPFRLIPHPNHAIVVVEIVVAPLVLGLVRLAAVFGVANLALPVFVRIPAGDRALGRT